MVACIVENTGDQEAGQHEKQLDAIGSVIGHADHGPFEQVGWRHGADEVEDQNHESNT